MYKFDFNHNINNKKRLQTMDTSQFLFGDVEKNMYFVTKAGTIIEGI